MLTVLTVTLSYTMIILCSFTAYPDDFEDILNDVSKITIANCFDLSEASDMSDKNSFMHTLRYLNVECNHDPIIVLGAVDIADEYIIRDRLEKALLACLGLNSADALGLKDEIADTAAFIDFGMRIEGVSYYGRDVETQVEICKKKV